MKKRLIIPCVLFSTMLAAQVNDNPQTITGQDDGFWSLTVIPKEFSYNEDNRMCLKLDEDKVAIYNNEFQCTKLLTIPSKFGKTRYVYEERKYLGKIVSVGWISRDPGYEVPVGWGNAQVIAYLSSEYGFEVSSMSTRDDVTTYLSDNQDDYYMYSQFGTQYPISCFVLLNSNSLYKETRSYEERDSYSDEWTMIGTEEWESDFEGALITDYNTSNYNLANSVLLTQTLFNEDESYEYLSFTYSMNSEASENCQETTILYNSNESYVDCIKRYKTYGSTVTGFEIKQDNGNTLQSIRFPNGFSMYYNMKKDCLVSIIHIGEYYYLIMTGAIDEESAMLVYRINRRDGSGLEQVCEPVRIGAYPNPASRNQTITIQLIGEKAGIATTELQITNLQGQVVGRCIMPAGEKKTTISSEKFVPGMNVINVLQSGKSVGKEKVIVK